jgi:uncharacterized membrane protein
MNRVIPGEDARRCDGVEGVIIAVSTAIPLLLAGLLMVWIASRARTRTLPPNSWIGIRTTATLSSEAAWRRGHAAAWASLLIGGLGLVAASIGALIAGDDFAIVAAMSGCAWIVIWLFVGSGAAAKAARQQDSRA